MSFQSQIDTILTNNSGDTPEELERKLSVFDVNDVVAVVAKRTAGAGSASNLPANWVRVRFDPTIGPLTTSFPGGGNPYIFQEADLSIVAQSGTDFSIGSDVSFGGTVESAAGGVFQCAAFVSVDETPPTIDPGSTAQRYLWFGAVPSPLPDADPDNPNTPMGVNFGFDLMLPVMAAPDSFSATVCAASSPSYATPGKPAYSNFFVQLLGGIVGDSVPLDGLGDACIWQIG